MLPRSVALAACACLLLAASGRLPAAADARRGLLVDGGGPGCDTCRRVTGDGVRVRTDPCTDATVLGLLFKGDKVKHTCTTFFSSCGHDWAEVEHKGRTAYVADEFLKAC